jgi:hypothetical protein
MLQRTVSRTALCVLARVRARRSTVPPLRSRLLAASSTTAYDDDVLFLFALSFLAAATFGSVVLYQKGEQRRLGDGGTGPDPRTLLPLHDDNAASASSSSGSASAPPVRVGDPTLETLQRGDVVEDGPDDYIVIGTVRYREERDTWALHVLDGGSQQRFLEVRRRNGDLEVAFVERTTDLPPGQLLQGLTFAGQSFQLEVRGDARTTVDGDVSGVAAGVIAWARYGAAGGGLLLVEDDAATRRAWVGARMPASSLSLLSGELNR